MKKIRFVSSLKAVHTLFCFIAMKLPDLNQTHIFTVLIYKIEKKNIREIT